jgi:hypothetical protein
MSALDDIASNRHKVLRTLSVDHRSIGAKLHTRMIELISEITSLERLSLHNFGMRYRQTSKTVYAAPFAMLVGLTNLKEFKMSEEVVSHHTGLDSVKASVITDDDVQFLSIMSKLEVLHLTGHTALSGNALIPVLKNNKNIKVRVTTLVSPYSQAAAKLTHSVASGTEPPPKSRCCRWYRRVCL